MYRLISSPATSLRRQAVTHPSLEMLDLEIMALDEEPSVRAALATTHRLSDELYAQLARDPAPSVRAALARNVKTPLALLNELVWRTQSTTFWVNFKVFGGIGLTMLFVVTQLPLLNHHKLPDDSAPTDES